MKIGSVIAAFVLCFSLAACGGGGGSSAVSSAAPAAASPAGQPGAPEAERAPMLMAAEGADTVLLDAAGFAAGEEKSIQVSMNFAGPTAMFILRPGENDAPEMMGIVGGGGQNFAPDLPLPEAYDEYGALNAGYMVQITALDLNADGTLEAVAALGNGLDKLAATVYALSDGGETFVPLGSLAGADYLYYKGDSLYVRTGGDGVLRYRCDGATLAEVPLQ